MSRTKINIKYDCDFEEAQSIIEKIMDSNGFNKSVINTGENVWKKGTGLLTAMQFIKIEFSQEEFSIYAWVQMGLGNFGGGEMDLTGFVAAIPKTALINTIEQIKNGFKTSTSN